MKPLEAGNRKYSKRVLEGIGSEEDEKGENYYTTVVC